MPRLYATFGFNVRLRHERERATKRLAKKAARLAGTLTGWARNTLVIGKRDHYSEPLLPPGVDLQTYQQTKPELLMELRWRRWMRSGR